MVQGKLEEVLELKERELKLYRKFLALKALCEETLFPALDFPLADHVARLKELIEKLIPDSRDRKEEMFSGEIFALLGSLYLHDVGLVRSPAGKGTDELFNALDRTHKTVIASNELGARIGLPAQAMEIINTLSLSHIIRKVPMKWEIEEGGRKAILRNTKVLQYLFNFSHLLLDVFYPDLHYPGLRRYGSLGLGLSNKKAGVEIDSREGVIEVTYRDASPYELHHLKAVQNFVNGAFHVFRNNVNGRLGFQYRKIKWDITGGLNKGSAAPPDAGVSLFKERDKPGFPRWEEGSSILDCLFENGNVVMVGEESVGKTTLLTSFVLPQLLSLASNTFYCELWKSPVNEIRDSICTRYENLGYSGLDIVSICSRLLEKGPCIFLLDSCERMVGLDQGETEKFERFLEFCFEKDNMFLVVSGEKETFFDWFGLFGKMKLSSIREVKAVEGEKAGIHYGERSGGWIEGHYYRPIECEFADKGIRLEEIIEGVAREAEDRTALRSMLAGMTEISGRHLKRYTMEEIRFETALPIGRIVENLYVLQKAGLVKETRLADSRFFSLSGRFVREPLHRILRLYEFDERGLLRRHMGRALVSDSEVDRKVLHLARKWKDRTCFSSEEMGLILAGLISAGDDYSSFVEKAARDGSGIDVQPILRFLYSQDVEKRKKAIELVIQVEDKKTINPLLRHLKKENVQEIRNILIKGMARNGNRGTMIAILQALREIGESSLRLKAIQFFSSLLEDSSKGLLLDIKATEEDPTVLAEVNRLLSKTGT